MEQPQHRSPLLDAPAKVADERPNAGAGGDQPIETAEGGAEGLKAYLRKKQAVARAVRSLEEFLKGRESEARAGECHELMVKLAEDRFTLAVVGQFKRGKSSLMNAVIGRDLLPTGLLPLTSAVTVLRFGPHERLMIPHEGWAFDEEAPLSALPGYVTERGNPGNRQQIKAVYVEVPSPFLRRGLEFVDTPGIGSAIEANTATTYGFLPQCDAVLFVTSVDTPLSAAETRFLRDLRQYIRKVFFVVNKADLVAERERADGPAFIAATLRRETGADDVRIFPVSARAALAAKSDNDAAALADSGLSALEEALAAFLSGERAATFLIAVLDRAIRLLRAECREIDLQTRVGETAADAREQRTGKLKEQLAQIRASYREHLARERAALAREAMAELPREADAFIRHEARQVQKESGDWVRGARRERVAAIARGCAGAVWSRCERALRAWANDQSAVIERRLREAVERDRQIVNRHAAAMSAAAGEVFGLAQVDAAEAAAECHEPLVMPVCALAPSLPPGRPRLPLWCRWWPARLLGSRLERMLSIDAHRWLAVLRTSVLGAFQKKVNEVVDRVAADLMEQMDRTEARVLQVVAKAAKNAESRCGPTTAVQPAEQAERRLRVERRLDGLRDQILGGLDVKAVAEESPATPAKAVGAVEGRHGAEAHADDAITNLAKRNCPMCDHVAHALFEFFGDAQYALATDEHAQRQHAQELGFCPLHTWHLSSIASPLGLSIAYPKLAERLAADLAALAVDLPPSGAAVERLSAKPSTCRACHFMRDVERKYVERMVPQLKEPAYRTAYSRSHGVCLRHLAMLLDAVADQQIARYLLTEAARRFVELSEDMQNFAIKRDATRRALLNRDELDAYLRTLVHLVGARYLSTPNPADAEF